MYLYICEAKQRNAFKKNNSPFVVHYACSFPYFLDTCKVFTPGLSYYTSLLHNTLDRQHSKILSGKASTLFLNVM
jgi:hypothetical protein